MTDRSAERRNTPGGTGGPFAQSERPQRAERVEFTVIELPPRKIGGQSIWVTQSEIPRIVALRKAALEAMAGSSPLSGEISLVLEVHIPWGALYSADVSDVVHGVCLSLSRATPRCKLNEFWEAPELRAIHPTICVAIVDSARVTFIYAQKIPYYRGESWYRVILDGER
jgi:hypothetical protein